MMRNIKNNTTGFTIVELLIATLVFSVILFIATYGIINIGRLYRKSINSNQTQQTARSVIDAVSQNIKFNGGVFSENTGAYCLGSNVRLSYAIGQKVSGNAHALVIDKVNCSIDTASKDLNLPLGANEKELLGPNMRLAKFYICYRGVDVANQPDCVGKNNIGEDLYYVLVRVTYGDDDLITNDFQNCKSSAGREFCAVAELGSYVQKVL